MDKGEKFKMGLKFTLDGSPYVYRAILSKNRVVGIEVESDNANEVFDYHAGVATGRVYGTYVVTHRMLMGKAVEAKVMYADMNFLRQF